MQLYLATTPDRLAEARQLTAYLAHVAYRISPDGHLHAQTLPPTLRGGLMVLGEAEDTAVPTPGPLCRQILRVCTERNFAGVVLDFPQPPTPDRLAFVQQLDTMLPRFRRRLYVPETYVAAAQYALILICTALSGGCLQQRLEEAVGRHSAPRIALDLQRLAMDFPLPSPSGEGTPIAIPELQRQITGRSVFFSEELCARYFTCQKNRHTHFVLYDDAHTLRRKMELAAQLGIQDGFVMLPETEDLLEDLFKKERS